VPRVEHFLPPDVHRPGGVDGQPNLVAVDGVDDDDDVVPDVNPLAGLA